MIRQKKSEPFYFGTGSHYLDSITLRDRWFYAQWMLREGKYVIVNYGFADKEKEAQAKIPFSGSVQRDDAHLKQIYSAIRAIQKEKDWTKKSRLHLFGVRHSPWRKVKPGWYIIRSRNQYPLYLSAVHVKRFSVWLVHAAVCENQNEVSDFIRQVNAAHHVQLRETIQSERLLKL